MMLSRMPRPVETRADKLTAPPRDPVLAEWWGMNALTASGVNVTADTALRLSAVYAAVRVLAETMASLPLVIYRRQPEGKVRDHDHPLWSLLHDRPNERQTSFEFREMLTAHTALRGVAYARKVDNGVNGRTMALVPLHPDRMRPLETPDGRLVFEHTPDVGGHEVLLEHEVLRLPGLATDLVRPLSPIALHRETVGLSLAGREYLARFYANGSAPKGAIKVPQALDPDAAKALIESWERRHGGLPNQHKLAVFDAGMEWVNIGLSNEDSQYLELQQFGVTDVARLFRIPPHKIADLSRSTFTNIEQQNIEFATDTITPWVRRWEDRLNLSLLSPSERRTHFIGFELKGLLRGDVAARSQFYNTMFSIGAMSPNEIRAEEDMRERAGGDTYYVPLNIAPSDADHVPSMRPRREAAQAARHLLNGSSNGVDHDAVPE